jgi:general L-amino acid transport system substrate-binding protein
MFRVILILILLGLGSIASLNCSYAQTLDSIRAAHHMECGAVVSAEDWSGEDIHGNLSALGGEICRAVGIAIFGDASNIKIQSFQTEQDALKALQSGAVQLVVGVSPSTSNATHFGVGFGLPIFYDSQRLVVSKLSGVTELAGLRDKLICAVDGTSPQQVLRDEMTARAIPYGLLPSAKESRLEEAMSVRRCDAGTAMESRLAQSRLKLHGAVDDFVFLPERFGLDPVVPAYRYGDQKFALLVDWTVSALVEAEALGITQTNVTAAEGREDMRAGQLLGHDFATAQSLGLAHDWAAKVIATTGNYGEIFQRTTGEPYHLDRGLNALWTNGGLMHPLPMR